MYSFHQGPYSEVSALSTPQKQCSSPLALLAPIGRCSPLLLGAGNLRIPASPFNPAHTAVNRRLVNDLLHVTYKPSWRLHVLSVSRNHPPLPSLGKETRNQCSQPFYFSPSSSFSCLHQTPPIHACTLQLLDAQACLSACDLLLLRSFFISPTVYSCWFYLYFNLQFRFPKCQDLPGIVSNARCCILKHTLFLNHDLPVCTSASEIRYSIF